MMKQYVQLWLQLAPRHRGGAVSLTLGNVIASVLEVLGIALFGAVLLRLTQGDAAAATQGLSGPTGLLGGADLRTVTVFCGVVYLVKNALMLALAWLEAWLAFSVQSHLSLLTLTAMMRQDYEEASRGNRNTKINLFTGGMYALAFNVLLPGLTLLAEGTLMLGLVLFLILSQPPMVGGMLATLCVVAGVLVLVSRRLVLQLGGARHRSEDDKLQLLTAIFGHLREMYIYSAGPRAVEHLRLLLAPLAATYRGFQLLQSAPRFLLELALVGVLLAIVFSQASSGIDPALVVSIGVFGVAGFRLLLGINRVVGCVQAMRFAGTTVDRINQALAGSAVPAAAPSRVSGRRHNEAPDEGLRLVGISYAYEPGKPTLEDVDFELPRSSLLAIKGPSGAGKSTLLDIMAGLRTPSSGWVELDGRRVRQKQDLVSRVAYAGQQPAVFPDTIRANVAFGVASGDIDDEAVWRALARARLDGFVRGLPGQLDHRLGFAQTLSGGQMQRLAIARALYMECDYLLLDEPTAALDPDTEAQLLSTLRQVSETRGVVVVSHRPAPIEAADAVWELREGRLVAIENSAVVES